MNNWWENESSETLWVEITDRSDLGKNIIAPKRAQQGKITPGYELLNFVSEGDVVFHWWMRPKAKESRGFYGYSRVVGNIQEGLLPWKSRGRYAINEPEVEIEKPATFWNLDGFTEFTRPILIGDINDRMSEIVTLLREIESRHGKPVYFPFCERQGKLAINQTYFAKLPIAFLEILKMDALTIPNQSIASIDNTTKILPTSRQIIVSGFSRQMDPLKRIAVEKYAEDMVFNMLVSEGYEVERHGKPFDLLAVKENEVIKVEVKGKQEFATNVEVTVNEVEVAKNRLSEYRTLLAVVDGIELTNSSGNWVGNNGRMRLWWDLIFSEESLYPTRYVFTLPDEEKPKN